MLIFLKKSVLFGLIFMSFSGTSFGKYLNYRSNQEKSGQSITIIGTGYVGLVTGAGLANAHHNVICADIDVNKIARLNNGEIPIYEPGLSDLVEHTVRNKYLTFTHDIPTALEKSDIIFIAVGTPMGEDGSADVSYIKMAVATIAQHINNYKIIVTKSTVPVGTGAWINQLLLDAGVDQDLFAVVSNPEFLREGSAVKDFLEPDRIVLGSQSEHALECMRLVYKSWLDKGVACITTNLATSELTKYAANAFLAVKISFINELANLCDKINADITTIALGMGQDKRISPYFLNPGPGFGGSCFPKDSLALLYTSNMYSTDLHVVKASLDANATQKKVAGKKVVNLLVGNQEGNSEDATKNKENTLAGKTVTVLGLAFKANTDDVRYSPALDVIQYLVTRGATIKAYDPQALGTMRYALDHDDITMNYRNAITLCHSVHEAVLESDVLIIMTEWDEFKTMNLHEIAHLMRNKIIVDSRNIIDIQEAKGLGFVIDSLGRATL